MAVRTSIIYICVQALTLDLRRICNGGLQLRMLKLLFDVNVEWPSRSPHLLEKVCEEIALFYLLLALTLINFGESNNGE